MPIYLKSIGFSIVLIGILEGVAEATAGAKATSENVLTAKRVPFVQLGYAFSAISNHDGIVHLSAFDFLCANRRPF
jgi:hypothetical protein